MITVSSCGHDSRHRKPCDIEHPGGLPEYLLLLVKRDAWYMDCCRKQPLSANSFILFPPGVRIHYGCDAPDYNDDWIHFDVSGERPAVLDFLATGTPLYPRDIRRLSEYIRQITDIFRSPSAHREALIDHMMQILLLTLDDDLRESRASRPRPKYYEEFSRIRTQIYNAPAAGWSIPDIAASLHISCSHFQHLYKDYFGCSCQQDLIQARLEMARFYLKTTDMGIRQVADFCGYENELHFMRQFKKFVGVTPSQYRAGE